MPALNTNLTIEQASQELQGMLHGTTLNQIADLYSVFYRAGRQILADCDPQETKCIETTQPIFSGVWDYPAPTDLKGNRITDLYPQVNRNLWDIFLQYYGQQFDVNKNFSLKEFFTVQFNNGVKSMRVNAPFIPLNQLVNPCAAIPNWVGSADVSNIQQDVVNFADDLSGASIEFNLASGTNPQTGTLTNSLNSTINLTGYQGQSSFFLWVYMPTGSNFSSVTIQVGSSASNYYTITSTQTQENTAFQNGWNLVQFIWTPQTTKVGTPNLTNITYIQIGLTYNGTAMNAVRICGFYCRVALVYNISYYSRFIFADAVTGAFKEIPTSTSDYINLDTETFNLYMWALAVEAVQQQHNADTKNSDIGYFIGKYQDALNTYTKKYPTESQKVQDQYYKLPRRNNQQWLGRYL